MAVTGTTSDPVPTLLSAFLLCQYQIVNKKVGHLIFLGPQNFMAWLQIQTQSLPEVIWHPFWNKNFKYWKAICAFSEYSERKIPQACFHISCPMENECNPINPELGPHFLSSSSHCLFSVSASSTLAETAVTSYLGWTAEESPICPFQIKIGIPESLQFSRYIAKLSGKMTAPPWRLQNIHYSSIAPNSGVQICAPMHQLISE